ncbi:MAG: hypothetical protein FJ360_03290 [Thaumarchaeota archaeon]|nr:hypothetical protein [Nitrososphaerota archaeon]
MNKILIARNETLEFFSADVLLVSGGILIGLGIDFTITIGSIFIGFGFLLGIRVLKKFQSNLQELRRIIEGAIADSNSAHKKIEKAMGELNRLKSEVERNTRKLADRIDSLG